MPENPNPESKRLEYMQLAETYDNVLGEFPYAPRVFDAVTSFVQQQVELNGTVQVLEYGFGTGLLTQRLAKLGKGVQIIGVDPSEEFFDAAQAKTKDSKNVRLIKGDAIDFEEEKLSSLVISTFTYHHIPDERKADFISSAARNLSDRGWLLIGDEFIRSFADEPDKAVAIKEFYKQADQYLAESGASSETLRLFNESLESSLRAEEEFKTSVDVLSGQLAEHGLTIFQIVPIWPESEEFDFGCKLIISQKGEK